MEALRWYFLVGNAVKLFVEKDDGETPRSSNLAVNVDEKARTLDGPANGVLGAAFERCGSVMTASAAGREDFVSVGDVVDLGDCEAAPATVAVGEGED